MALDMERYLSRLEEWKAPQRYKIERFTEQEVIKAITETYVWQVKADGKKYDPKTEQHIGMAAKWLCGDYKNGLLIYGTVGSGKTTLMDCIVKLISIIDSDKAHNNLGRYTAIDLANKFVDAEEAYKIKSLRLLFIDDLGEEPVIVKDYGNERSPLIETLYHRYDKRMFTVLTTNKTEEEIRLLYGVRIKDRFKDMFDRIYFSHDSFRGK